MNRFEALLENCTMNLTEFCEYFEIPYKTAQKWKAGERNAPAYTLNLLEYKLREDKLMKQYTLIFDKQVSSRTYTLEELKLYFQPSEEVEEAHPGTIERWSEIQTIEDLREFVEYDYHGDKTPYEFEEV